MSSQFRIWWLSISLVLNGQTGEFVNLDFNHPDPSRAWVTQDGALVAPPEDALRGWSLAWDWVGTVYEMPTYMGLIDGDAPVGLAWRPPDAFNSVYELRIQDTWAQRCSPPGTIRPVLHLFQVGTVPEGATELRYAIYNPYPGTRPYIMECYIDGVLQEQHPAFGGYALDVSASGGQDIKLEFVFPSGGEMYYTFDVFGFVPEPSPVALLGLGGAMLWWTGRRRRV